MTSPRRRPGDALWELLAGHHPATRFGAAGWQPQADVVVTTDRAWVRIEVAGVRADDLRIQVRGRTLVITGSRRAPTFERGADYLRSEIAFGAFQRRLELPWVIDVDRLAHAYRDGILECSILRAGAATAAAPTSDGDDDQGEQR
ncbi:MAG: Hsp20/alpha crystallin family protein [Myxococcales bacterium]|nr:Hsp20/alpha crystallin family protein [Myxococcales bacterium]MCB9702297.1 Hsp20/alpha crystallin family protein [Myxococcales bacterium]